MVLMDATADAERISKEVARLRGQLGVKPEFKFSRCHPNIRDEFFRQMASMPFSTRALVVDKRRVYSPQLRGGTDYLYSHFVRMLFEHDNNRLEGARVKIEGTGSHKFVRALEVYLRQRLSEGKIAKLSFADSRMDNLIQLADCHVRYPLGRERREGPVAQDPEGGFGAAGCIRRASCFRVFRRCGSAVSMACRDSDDQLHTEHARITAKQTTRKSLEDLPD